jgi:hypothetical protein
MASALIVITPAHVNYPARVTQESRYVHSPDLPSLQELVAHFAHPIRFRLDWQIVLNFGWSVLRIH